MHNPATGTQNAMDFDAMYKAIKLPRSLPCDHLVPTMLIMLTIVAALLVISAAPTVVIKAAVTVMIAVLVPIKKGALFGEKIYKILFASMTLAKRYCSGKPVNNRQASHQEVEAIAKSTCKIAPVEDTLTSQLSLSKERSKGLDFSLTTEHNPQ